jgi:type VI secretion system protein ImpL
MTWIICVLLLWVVSLLLSRWFGARAGRLIEKALVHHANDAVVGASASRRAEVNQLRERLLDAIKTLQDSEIGKAHGSEVLYKLPWYMIIGHPAAGKSSAILHSGLTLPFSDKAGVQGVGGTRNCDWFLTTEGILLDTAGRYATGADDRGEWLAFLKLLKRHRSKAPVNGILIATSLPELMEHNSGRFDLYVRQLRERIHEIEDVFGLHMPIYLLFTKLDLMGGFPQFFEELDEAERGQVWGATLGHERKADFNPRREVERQLDVLFHGLQQIGIDRLGKIRGAVKPALIAFPIEFHALREAIGRFIELLHEEDPYHAKPLLRGFYFTSALQQGGIPQIMAATKVSKQFSLVHNETETKPPAQSHGYFLRDFFRQVLFPDQYFIWSQTKPRASTLRVAGMLAGVVFLLGAAALLTQSFLGNQDMISVVRLERDTANKLFASEELHDRLKGLTLLKNRLEQLQRFRAAGVPLKIGAGLYQGRPLEVSLRKRFFDEVRLVMLAPVQADLEGRLAQVTSAISTGSPNVVRTTPSTRPGDSANAQEEGDEQQDPAEQGYEALKTYLMLAERARLDGAWLTGQLPRYWSAYLKAQRGAHSQEEVDAEAIQILEYYLSQLRAPDLPLIQNQAEMVTEARQRLSERINSLPPVERVYAELKARANANFPSISVAAILSGKDSAVMSGTAVVSGAFTRRTWEEYMQAAIKEASGGEIKSDDWVLASTTLDDLSKSNDNAATRNELEALYRADYAEQWVKFLQGVTFPIQSDTERAESALERLTDPRSSPIKLLLQRAAFETGWDNPTQLSSTVSDTRQSVQTRVTAAITGSGSRAPQLPNQQSHYGELGQRFALLSILTNSNNPQSAALMNGYLEHLAKLKVKFNQINAADENSTAMIDLIGATLDGKAEFVDATAYVDNIMLGSTDSASRSLLRELLVEPLLQSFAVLLPPLEDGINDLWASEVYEDWIEMAGKYPFSDSQHEVPLSEVIRFLKPGDGAIDKFVDEYLENFVHRRGSASQLTPRTWNNMGIRFNAAFLDGARRLSSIGASLAKGGSGSSLFELQPVPTPSLQEITVEIDGQTLRYRNGPQMWQSFKWPNGDAQGARIQVVAFDGSTSVVSNQPGRMGLMRMIGAGKRSALDANMKSGRLEWRLKGAGETDTVKFNIRVVSGVNPLQLADLRHLTLPKRIVR